MHRALCPDQTGHFSILLCIYADSISVDESVSIEKLPGVFVLCFFLHDVVGGHFGSASSFGTHACVSPHVLSLHDAVLRERGYRFFFTPYQ